MSAASTSAGTVFPFDWAATLLERRMRPRLPELRLEFFRAYLQAYADWTSDPIHSAEGVFSTEKCWRLVEIADDHLQRELSPYPRRILMQAVRTIPLTIVGLLSQLPLDQTVDLIGVATLCAWRWGANTPPDAYVTEGKNNALLVNPEEWEPLEAGLPQCLARLLGLVFARKIGEEHYRGAGKGETLEFPEPLSMDNVILPSPGQAMNGIIVVPMPSMAPDEDLARSIHQYEMRRDRQRGLGASGFCIDQDDVKEQGTELWWSLALASHEGRPYRIEVYYPSQDLTLVTESYWHRLRRTRYFDYLGEFSAEFISVFGFDFESFRAICLTLTRLVNEETGRLQLTLVHESPGLVAFRSGLRGEVAQGAAHHLYSFLARGLLRAPRKNFVTRIIKALERIGKSDAGRIADTFIRRFSVQRADRRHLEPSLFYEIDDSLLVLDGFFLSEFLDFCLREVASRQDEIGNQRSRRFEQDARDWITSGLQLKAEDVPFSPNRDLKADGRNYGDVDFAFLRGDVLFHMDMKSWQKNDSYLRGDYKPIDNRQKELARMLTDKIIPRGEKLRETLNRERARPLRAVLNFLCVASVEFVSPRYPDLWYGEIPKVLTPAEIVELALDEAKVESLVRCNTGLA